MANKQLTDEQYDLVLDTLCEYMEQQNTKRAMYSEAVNKHLDKVQQLLNELGAPVVASNVYYQVQVHVVEIKDDEQQEKLSKVIYSSSQPGALLLATDILDMFKDVVED